MIKKFAVGGQLHFGFKCALLAALLLTSVPYMKWVLESWLKLFLVWGAVCAAGDLIGFFYRKYNRANIFVSRSVLLLFAFCLSYTVTAFINRGANFSGNVSGLLYMAVLFWVCLSDRGMGTPGSGRGRAEHAGSSGRGMEAPGSGRNRTERAGSCDQGMGTGARRVSDAVCSEIKVLARLVSVGIFVLSAVCFATFALDINVMYQRGERLGYIGIWDGRLWGLYNANTGGMLCAISALISLSFVLFEGMVGARAVEGHGSRSKGWRLFDVINIVLQIVCLALSYSRTSMVALAVGVAVLAWFAAPMYMYRRRAGNRGEGSPAGRGNLPLRTSRAHARVGNGAARTLPYKFCVAAVSAVAVVAACLALNLLLMAVRGEPTYKPGSVLVSAGGSAAVYASAGSDAEVYASAASDADVFARAAGDAKLYAIAEGDAKIYAGTDELPVDIDEEQEGRGGSGILTGRPILWESGFLAFLEAPLFGVGRENLYDRTEPHLVAPGWRADLAAGGVHNGPLTVLISSGIIGFIPVAAFFIIELRRLILRLKDQHYEAEPCEGSSTEGPDADPVDIISGGDCVNSDKRPGADPVDKVSGKDRNDPHDLSMVFAYRIGLFAVVAAILITELTEARILYQLNFFMAIFWIATGYALKLSVLDR